MKIGGNVSLLEITNRSLYSLHHEPGANIHQVSQLKKRKGLTTPSHAWIACSPSPLIHYLILMLKYSLLMAKKFKKFN
jgi:hypothetical protein